MKATRQICTRNEHSQQMWPIDILAEIFTYFEGPFDDPVNRLANVSLVCKQWRAATKRCKKPIYKLCLSDFDNDKLVIYLAARGYWDCLTYVANRSIKYRRSFIMTLVLTHYGNPEFMKIYDPNVYTTSVICSAAPFTERSRAGICKDFIMASSTENICVIDLQYRSLCLSSRVDYDFRAAPYDSRSISEICDKYIEIAQYITWEDLHWEHGLAEIEHKINTLRYLGQELTPADVSKIDVWASTYRKQYWWLNMAMSKYSDVKHIDALPEDSVYLASAIMRIGSRHVCAQNYCRNKLPKRLAAALIERLTILTTGVTGIIWQQCIRETLALPP